MHYSLHTYHKNGPIYVKTLMGLNFFTADFMALSKAVWAELFNIQ